MNLQTPLKSLDTSPAHALAKRICSCAGHAARRRGALHLLNPLKTLTQPAPMPRQAHALSRRARLPGGAAPFTLFYLSALLHNPVSVACSCFVGVSDAARAFWRMLDVMLIFTCAGGTRRSPMYC